MFTAQRSVRQCVSGDAQWAFVCERVYFVRRGEGSARSFHLTGGGGGGGGGAMEEYGLVENRVGCTEKSNPQITTQFS